MKQLFITLLMSLLLFTACSEEQLEMMPPYIFFTYDVDTYVMDTDNPDLSAYAIKGSISAQGGFEKFVMGDEQMEKDVLGDSLNMMFEYVVPIQGKTDAFDVNFILTDQTGQTVSKPFHFKMPNPIDTYSVTMGAQNNSYTGFFFSYDECKVYSVAEMKQMVDPKGFCFGYNVNKKVPMLVSPSELINQTVLTDYKGKSISSFCELVAYNGLNFTKEWFNELTNDALMRNLNPIEYGTYPYIEIVAGKAYLFKNEDDTRRGILYVNALESGIAGQIQVDIKIQR